MSEPDQLPPLTVARTSTRPTGPAIPTVDRDLEAEEWLIGWILAHQLDADQLGVAPRMWTDQQLAAVASHLLPVQTQVLPKTLAERIEPNRVKAAKLQIRLTQLADARRTDPLHEAKAWAQRLGSNALRRAIQAIALRAAEDAADPTMGDEDLVIRVREEISTLDRWVPGDGDLPMDIDSFIDGADYSRDWVLPYFLCRGERLIITALPGVGKSTTIRGAAMKAHLGIHPFSDEYVVEQPEHLPRVLLVDMENSRTKVARTMAYLRRYARQFDTYDPGRFAAREGNEVRLDLTTPAGFAWMCRQIEATTPDVVFIGPLYRLGPISDASMGGRGAAAALIEAVDAIRVHYNVAVVIEAHSTKEGGDNLKPFGSGQFGWWTDFGIGLRPKRDDQADDDPDAAARKLRTSEVEVVHWRDPRDEHRIWPARLARGGPWMWQTVAFYDDPELGDIIARPSTPNLPGDWQHRSGPLEPRRHRAIEF